MTEAVVIEIKAHPVLYQEVGPEECFGPTTYCRGPRQQDQQSKSAVAGCTPWGGQVTDETQGSNSRLGIRQTELIAMLRDFHFVFDGGKAQVELLGHLPGHNGKRQVGRQEDSFHHELGFRPFRPVAEPLTPDEEADVQLKARPPFLGINQRQELAFIH
jgi:hypothetical protein